MPLCYCCTECNRKYKTGERLRLHLIKDHGYKPEEVVIPEIRETEVLPEMVRMIADRWFDYTRYKMRKHSVTFLRCIVKRSIARQYIRVIHKNSFGEINITAGEINIAVGDDFNQITIDFGKCKPKNPGKGAYSMGFNGNFYVNFFSLYEQELEHLYPNLKSLEQRILARGWFTYKSTYNNGHKDPHNATVCEDCVFQREIPGSTFGKVGVHKDIILILDDASIQLGWRGYFTLSDQYFSDLCALSKEFPVLTEDHDKVTEEIVISETREITSS